MGCYQCVWSQQARITYTCSVFRVSVRALGSHDNVTINIPHVCGRSLVHTFRSTAQARCVLCIYNRQGWGSCRKYNSYHLNVWIVAGAYPAEGPLFSVKLSLLLCPCLSSVVGSLTDDQHRRVGLHTSRLVSCLLAFSDPPRIEYILL